MLGDYCKGFQEVPDGLSELGCRERGDHPNAVKYLVTPQ